MAHLFHAKLDGFSYEILESDVPALHADGTVNGQTVHIHTLVIDDQIGAHVEVVFTDADWAEFKNNVLARKLTIADKLPPG